MTPTQTVHACPIKYSYFPVINIIVTCYMVYVSTTLGADHRLLASLAFVGIRWHSLAFVGIRDKGSYMAQIHVSSLVGYRLFSRFAPFLRMLNFICISVTSNITQIAKIFCFRQFQGGVKIWQENRRARRKKGAPSESRELPSRAASYPQLCGAIISLTERVQSRAPDHIFKYILSTYEESMRRKKCL